MPDNLEPFAFSRRPTLADAPWHRHEGLALAAGALRWDHARLHALSAARARHLLQTGLMPGQVVICPVHPAAELILMQHALARAGAALLPVRVGPDDANAGALIRATGAEWTWRPSDASDEPRADAGRLEPTGAGRDQTGPTPAAPERPGAGADPLALLVRTSGSAGQPKVAMLSAGNLLASAAAINDRLGLGAGDAWLGVLPRQHVGGLAIGWRCALAGAGLVAHETFDVPAVRAELETPAAAAITHLSLVPPMLARLLEAGAEPPPSLRVVLLGGQALDPALARRAVAAGWPLVMGYGMTETGSMIAGGWVGQDGDVALAPLPGVELDCPGCDAAGAPAASGPPLRIRGPMLMAGYANPRRSRGDGLDAGGWLVTSDLACREAGGRLRVLGRADDCLVIGGVNVPPAQVERALSAAPGIGDVAVIGVPEPVWGHRLVAVYTGPIAAADLDAWCRARGFRRVARLPLLPSGKLDRRALAGVGTARTGERDGYE